MRRWRFSRQRGVTLALLAMAAVVAAPAAFANSDADFAAVIAAETEQFNREISAKAAEMQSKGEVPKTGPLTARSPSCAGQAPSQPFGRFGDAADYTLLPGGTFESGVTGWTLENAARIVAANSPFNSSGPGTKALSLRKGDKVTTSPVCITAAHPTLRFFATAKGSSRARLFVEVLYEDLGGSVNAMPIAYLKPSSSWQPTIVIPLHVNLRAAVAPTSTAAVAFRITAEEDLATWTIDDLYVDPLKII
jgi:hypothetical protein